MTEPDSHPDRADLAGVLHDVSNALTVLLGWVGEARAPDATPESLASALRNIEQRARIARDLARRAIGGPRIDQQLPFGEVVRDVVASLRVEAARGGVTVAIEGDAGSAAVSGALDIAQVVTNIVMNALAFAPPASKVTVAVGVDGDGCAVTVTDEGTGVPEALREEIFRGTSQRPGGTGIGLRHARALAQAWGGDVVLLPALAGAGARFRVTWPHVDAAPRPSLSVPRIRELDGLRVLVVEDDRAVVQLLETALESRGAEVTVVSTGADLSAALATIYGAALVDLSPIAADPNGAIERLRSSSPGIDLVFISGSADRLPDAVASEGTKLVRKPFELSEIFAALTKKV